MLQVSLMVEFSGKNQGIFPAFERFPDALPMDEMSSLISMARLSRNGKDVKYLHGKKMGTRGSDNDCNNRG